jgi:hypothetical protein
VWFRGAVCIRLGFGFGGLDDLLGEAAVFGAGRVEVCFGPVGSGAVRVSGFLQRG